MQSNLNLIQVPKPTLPSLICPSSSKQVIQLLQRYITAIKISKENTFYKLLLLGFTVRIAMTNLTSILSQLFAFLD